MEPKIQARELARELSLAESLPAQPIMNTERISKILWYDEALRGTEIVSIVSYFLPHVIKRDCLGSLWSALNNPLNISALAQSLGIDCPAGYSYEEMQARINATYPCRLCGGPLRVFDRNKGLCVCMLEAPYESPYISLF
jgi:hypothetical protein